MSETVSESGKDSQDAKIIDLKDYRELEAVNPADLTNEETINFLLSVLSHPSVTGNPGRAARRILKLLSELSTETAAQWVKRTGELGVDVGDIDDEAYGIVREDEIVASGLALIASKNGHYQGNEEILDAARALINLRAGIVLNHEDLKDVEIGRWASVIEGLGQVAVVATNDR